MERNKSSCATSQVWPPEFSGLVLLSVSSRWCRSKLQARRKPPSRASWGRGAWGGAAASRSVELQDLGVDVGPMADVLVQWHYTDHKIPKDLMFFLRKGHETGSFSEREHFQGWVDVSFQCKLLGGSSHIDMKPLGLLTATKDWDKEKRKTKRELQLKNYETLRSLNIVISCLPCKFLALPFTSKLWT